MIDDFVFFNYGEKDVFVDIVKNIVNVENVNKCKELIRLLLFLFWFLF